MLASPALAGRKRRWQQQLRDSLVEVFYRTTFQDLQSGREGALAQLAHYCAESHPKRQAPGIRLLLAGHLFWSRKEGAQSCGFFVAPARSYSEPAPMRPASARTAARRPPAVVAWPPGERAPAARRSLGEAVGRTWSAAFAVACQRCKEKARSRVGAVVSLRGTEVQDTLLLAVGGMTWQW